MGVPIQLIDIDLPFVRDLGPLLDADTCASLLQAGDLAGWQPGTVNSREGRVVRPHLRDVDVAVLRGRQRVNELEQRARHLLPPRVKGGRLVGLRDPLRIYRYRPGQFFGLHRDEKYRVGDHIAHLALLVYLCDTEEGGATWFMEADHRFVPREGHGLWFQNATLHAGEPVRRGSKAVLRADVLYTAS